MESCFRLALDTGGAREGRLFLETAVLLSKMTFWLVRIAGAAGAGAGAEGEIAALTFKERDLKASRNLDGAGTSLEREGRDREPDDFASA